MTEIEHAVIREDLESVPPGHIRRSNGSIVAVAAMGVHHLRSTHAKLLCEEPWRIGEIEDSAAELAKRDAEYAAQNPEQPK
jgi:hypothetical protein